MAAVIRRAMRLAPKKLRDAYAGAVIDDWIAPPLTDANPSPVPWTEEELFSYLRTGAGRLHGAAIGATMTPVIRDALALPVVPDCDVRAIATYFSDIDHADARASDVEATVTRSAGDISHSAADRSTTQTPISMPPPVFRATTMPGQLRLPPRPGTGAQQRAHAARTDQFHSACAERCRQHGRCAGPGHACLRLVLHRRRNRQDSRLICVAPARHVRRGPTWKRTCRCHPPAVGGIALTERAQQEPCDHDHIQSQWPRCFGAQPG